MSKKNNLKEMMAAKAHENSEVHRQATYEPTFDLGRQHKMIAIESINQNRFQPRRTMSEDGLKELAASISVSGLLQPISVREISVNQFELIAGQRRLKAHELLQKKNIEAIVISASDEEAAALSLSENLRREDLVDYEAALAIQGLNEIMENKSKLGETLGLSRSELYRYLSFFKLPDFVRNDLDVNPRLLSRRFSEQLVSTLGKIGDKDVADVALRRVWPQLVSGKIDASQICQKVLMPEATVSKMALQKEKFLRSGEKVGTLAKTANEVVFKFDSDTFSDNQLDVLKNFITKLLEENQSEVSSHE